MAEWRIGRGWSEDELGARLASAGRLPRNFSVAADEMSLENGWNHYYSESVLASEAPGPPEAEGAFERARVAVASYEFSDPAIVVGHFDPRRPLEGRRMLLEIKIWGLHYLAGVVIAEVRSETGADQSVFGFRYDTLEGHIERGAEWFLVTKDHRTGEVSFRVDAYWLPGDFPNTWSRIGFLLLARRYQRRWHLRAHARLFVLAHDGSLTGPRPPRGQLAHEGPDVLFRYLRAKKRR